MPWRLAPAPPRGSVVMGAGRARLLARGRQIRLPGTRQPCGFRWIPVACRTGVPGKSRTSHSGGAAPESHRLPFGPSGRIVDVTRIVADGGGRGKGPLAARQGDSTASCSTAKATIPYVIYYYVYYHGRYNVNTVQRNRPPSRSTPPPQARSRHPRCAPSPPHSRRDRSGTRPNQPNHPAQDRAR